VNSHIGADPASSSYPIGEIFRYDPPVRLTGFAASSVVEIKFGIILFVTFVGDCGGRATVPIEFRVVPSELDSSGLPLLSASTTGPEGLDIRTTVAHHVLSKLNLKCPRAELTSSSRSSPIVQVEENYSVMRCVGSEVLVPAGGMAEVKISYPPEGLGNPLWVRSAVDVPALRDGLVDVRWDPQSPAQLTVVEGPIEIPASGDGTLGVFVRAPEDTDVLVEPGMAVCLVSQAVGVEEEMSFELAEDESMEVRFDGNPPRAWTRAAACWSAAARAAPPAPPATWTPDECAMPTLSVRVRVRVRVRIRV